MSKSTSLHWPPKIKWKVTPLSFWAVVESAITKQPLVWLLDFDGHLTLTVARKPSRSTKNTEEGILFYAPRFWPTFRVLALMSDGTIGSENSVSYTKYWTYHNQVDQFVDVLKNTGTISSARFMLEEFEREKNQTTAKQY